MATIPTNISYACDPVAATAVSNVIALTVPSDWTLARGSTGRLLVEVTTDGDSCAIRRIDSTAAIGLFPKDVINFAKLDGTTNIVMRTDPIARSEVTGYELICSAAETEVVLRWIPTTEQGA